MEIILIPLTYYIFVGLMIVYSIMNNLDLLLKITNNKYLLNIYMLFELIISSIIIFYSLIKINYVLLVVGLLVFLPTIYGFWARREMVKMMNTIGNKIWLHSCNFLLFCRWINLLFRYNWLKNCLEFVLSVCMRLFY